MASLPNPAPEKTPPTVREREEQLERLRRGVPVVPTTANGGLKKKSPVEPLPVVFGYDPDEPAPPAEDEGEPAEASLPAEEVAAAPAEVVLEPVGVAVRTESKAQWSIDEMLSAVVEKVTLEKIITHAISKLDPAAAKQALDTVMVKVLDQTPRDKVKQLIETSQGRTLKLNLATLYFQASAQQVQFYIKRADIPAEFEEGLVYEFEHLGERYKGIYMGSFLPSQSFPYPLLSFVKEP